VRALLSVSDLDGLIAFARGLRDLGWDLVATDGTRAALLSEGIEARSVEDVTGAPALLGGRVKTLHPRIHAAVLARRDDPAHQEELAREGIEPIDLVAVNLYPFSRSAAAGKRGAELHENIDIGGVALLRAGAKNYQDVVVVSRPSRYQAVLDELRERGSVSHETRRMLAAEAFSHTAAYDAAIASRFVADAGISFPDEMALALRKVRDLRYGENPHQQAAFYALRGEEEAAMVAMEQLHGKAASFNNLLDINAAWRLASDFTQPTVAIVKHQNPCGIASELDITSAYKRAFMCDSVSAFGGIVGANRTVTKELAEAMQDTFYEAIIAPGYEPDALPLLKQRKNLEILSVPNALVGKHLRRPDARAFDMKRVAGGLLVQTPDETVADESNFKVVTERKPTLEELTDLIFAWRCVRHVTSNAIVLAKQLATVGVGPGQLSRVVAVEVAVRKAGENARLAVMSSDAYFPFPDGIEVAARAGVTAIIQPGGSMRDAMMIETANKHRMAMLFTGRRHFKH
jgi:phosphoribosylaminoimidazolecarboxamide formyltransferase/IMP cyclohydrolase